MGPFLGVPVLVYCQHSFQVSVGVTIALSLRHHLFYHNKCISIANNGPKTERQTILLNISITESFSSVSRRANYCHQRCVRRLTMHHFGEGKAGTQTKLTLQSKVAVQSHHASLTHRFSKRESLLLSWIFLTLQFILERHPIRLLAVCAQSMGKILSEAIHLTALPFEIHQQLNFYSKSNYLFILPFLNNHHDQIKAFL